MNKRIDIEDVHFVLTIDYDGDPANAIPADDPQILAFVGALIAFHQTTPLTSLTIKQFHPQPERFDYRLLARDGRTWNQDIYVEERGVATATFDVKSRWALFPEGLEFTRNLRVHVLAVSMILFRGVTDIDVRFK